MNRIYYKSDFPLIVGIPTKYADYSFKLTFQTNGYTNYTASFDGTTYVNCAKTSVDEAKGITYITVYFDSHKLKSGNLYCIMEFKGYDTNYSTDKINNIIDKYITDVKLVDEPTCLSDADVILAAKFYKGDKGDKGDKGEKGDPFTYSDFTSEQIANLQKPATEAASNLTSFESSITNAENGRVIAENTRVSNETNRVGAESVRATSETKRVDAESKRVDAENNRASAEYNRNSAETTRESNSVTAVTNANNAAASANTAASNANTAANSMGYLVCSTDASTAAKTVDDANFVLSTKARLLIRMANYNSAASPTLNVNGSGAKAIWLGGSVASASNTWCAGDVLDFYFDGTYWQANVVSDKELLFRDMWKSVCGSYGQYNITTGYYELNGLTDIIYEQAIAIYNEFVGNRNAVNLNQLHRNSVCRSNLRPFNKEIGSFGDLADLTAAYRESSLETIGLTATDSQVILVNKLSYSFSGSLKLFNIYGIIDVSLATQIYNPFIYCYKLMNCNIKGINLNISFPNSPLISYESIKYLVDNKKNSTTAITVTVHATTYSYLTGTATADQYTATGHTSDEWQAIVTNGTSKALTFASA